MKVKKSNQREREELRADSRKLKVEKEEIDSQLKVFFKELREIKAVIRDTRSSMLDTRKKKRNGKGALNSVKRVTRKGRKMKFRPEITRVKLNPEQAVLTCNCYAAGWRADGGAWTGAWYWSEGETQVTRNHCLAGGPPYVRSYCWPLVEGWEGWGIRLEQTSASS